MAKSALDERKVEGEVVESGGEVIGGGGGDGNSGVIIPVSDASAYYSSKYLDAKQNDTLKALAQEGFSPQYIFHIRRTLEKMKYVRGLWNRKKKDEMMSGREEIKTRIRAWLNDSYSRTEVARAEKKEDAAFYDGKGGLMHDNLAKRDPRFHDLRINVIAPPIDYMIGTTVNRKVEGKVMPAGSTSIKDAGWLSVASEADKRLKAVWTSSRGARQWREAVKQCIKRGEGWIKTGVAVDPDTPVNLNAAMPVGKDNNFDLRPNLMVYFKQIPDQNMYVDPMSREPDLSDARWSCEFVRKDLDSLIASNPDMKEELEQLSSGVDDEVSWDSENEFLQYQYQGRTYRVGFGTAGLGDFYGRSDEQRKIVNVCEFYWYEWINDPPSGSILQKGERVMCRMKFATDDSFEKIVPLGNRRPAFFYAHNSHPYSRLIFRMMDDTNECYSPAIRHFRGAQRALNAFFRSTINHAIGKEIPINFDALYDFCRRNKITSPRALVEKFKREATNPVRVVPQFGQHNTPPRDNSGLFQQSIAALNMIRGMIESERGIDPNVTGQKNNIVSGIGQEQKRMDANLSMTELFENLNDAMSSIYEKCLSLIEQFEPNLSHRAFLDEGGNVKISGDGDVSLMGNRYHYQITTHQRDETQEREIQMMVMEYMKRADANMGAVLLPMFMRHTGTAHAVEMSFAWAGQMMRQGLQVPDWLLTDEDKKLQVEMQQAQNKKRQEAEQLQMAGAGAEVEKTGAEAAKNEADAVLKTAQAEEIAAGGGEKGGGDGDKDEAGVREENARLRRIIAGKGAGWGGGG